MVERAFSLLTLLLSGKRHSLKHETIESLMEINLSDKIWTEKEKNVILERAVDVYLIKRQGKKITEPPKKVSRMECDNENTQERLSESHEEDKIVLLILTVKKNFSCFISYFILSLLTCFLAYLLALF